jgi:hypothetical protein
MTFLGYGFALIGSAFLIASIYSLVSSLLFVARAVEVKTRVIDNVKTYSTRKDSHRQIKTKLYYHPVATYNIDGKAYSKKLPQTRSEPFEMNEELVVLVDPRNPESPTIKKVLLVRTGAFLLFGLAFFFAAWETLYPERLSNISYRILRGW